MPWWGWLLIGTLATAAVVFLVMWLTKNGAVAGLSDEEKKELSLAGQAEIAKKLETEKQRSKKLELIAAQLRDNIKNLNKDFGRVKVLINEERKKELERLSNDNDALGDELDQLLGIKPRDTDPG